MYNILSSNHHTVAILSIFSYKTKVFKGNVTYTGIRKDKSKAKLPNWL